MSRQMSSSTIHAINSALLFTAGGKYEAPRIRPWQYVQMEYERVGLAAPVKPHIVDGGIFICSGIAVNRLEDVLAELNAAGYQVLDTLIEGEWSAVASRK